MVPNYTLSYASVAPWLTFGATPATCTATGPTNSSCPQPTPKLGWMVESLEIDPFDSNHMLYGTGAIRVNDATGAVERVGGVKYVMKDGIVYDAKQLLRDVEAIVARAKK